MFLNKSSTPGCSLQNWAGLHVSLLPTPTLIGSIVFHWHSYDAKCGSNLYELEKLCTVQVHKAFIIMVWRSKRLPVWYLTMFLKLFC